ncbi:MAG: ATP-binding protein [Candidatus Bipolaricaulota bacterium]
MSEKDAKQLLVISGKGGTGKTTIVASFAALANGEILSDCDVDAADLHLILHPEVNNREEFSGGKVAVKEDDLCTTCGICREYCRYGAIDENLAIDSFSCEGCGVCEYVCPEDAITMEPVLSGYAIESDTEYGEMVHGELVAGEETSGKLVTDIKQKARKIAKETGEELIIIDGSPGIGCPVIASLSNVDLALIVTEPTLSGLSDLNRVIGLLNHFEIQGAIAINKYDLNSEVTRDIEDIATENGLDVVGKIPYDSVVTEAMVHEQSVVEYSSGTVSLEIESIWKKVKSNLRDDHKGS